MEPKKLGDVQNWSLFLATDDLSLIPHELEFRAGGLAHLVPIQPRKWVENPVYHRFDLPPMMISYQPPRPQAQAQTTRIGPTPNQDDDDVLPMRITVLREILKHIPNSDLPEDLVACLAGNKAASQPNHPTHLRPERQLAGQQTQQTQESATCPPATSDPPIQTLGTPNPAAHSSSPNPAPPPLTDTATVHRTDQPTTRDDHMTPDLSLEVCPQAAYQDRLDTSRNNWDPHLLFPELRAPATKKGKEPFIASRTITSRGRKPPRSAPPHPLTRTSEGRISKKTDTKKPFGNLEAKDFVDIPLKYAEGRQLLDLIGGHSIPIPQHLMDSAQTLTKTGLAVDPQRPLNPPAQPATADGLSSTKTGPSPSGAGLFRAPQQDHDGPSSPEPSQAHLHQLPPTDGPQIEAVNNGALREDDLDDPYMDTVDYSEEEYVGLD